MGIEASVNTNLSEIDLEDTASFTISAPLKQASDQTVNLTREQKKELRRSKLGAGPTGARLTRIKQIANTSEMNSILLVEDSLRNIRVATSLCSDSERLLVDNSVQKLAKEVFKLRRSLVAERKHKKAILNNLLPRLKNRSQVVRALNDEIQFQDSEIFDLQDKLASLDMPESEENQTIKRINAQVDAWRSEKTFEKPTETKPETKVCTPCNKAAYDFNSYEVGESYQQEDWFKKNNPKELNEFDLDNLSELLVNTNSSR